MSKRPVLVTLTSPTASGKSYLLNYIRDVAKLPCLVSTTTRPPRVGEVEGRDYFFISEEESRAIEEQDGFAELAIYRGVRYGVTRQEFSEKLSQGMTFLIVEPSGIDSYIAPAVEAGAHILKYFVYADEAVRIKRFTSRLAADISEMTDRRQLERTVASYVDRLVSMIRVEPGWSAAAEWDGVLSGETAPEKNLEIILEDVEYVQNTAAVQSSPQSCY